ncbi:MAG TPA: iron-sulfur cluster assembly scaffold protein [Sphingomicrobium sp.]|nr:iron-sulfur cluster assembly scaffold protein [Sphingomicrobium sp.]
MNAPLYTIEVLRLAASLCGPRTLDREDGAADVRSPTCGSRIRAAVQLDADGRVEALSMDVHACAFGQASAALVEQHGRGLARPEVAAATLAMSRWLEDETEDPVPWTGIEALNAARNRKSRHGAILLPFRALLAAIESAS